MMLRQAAELFRRRGYSAVSLDEIAHAAGLHTSSAVYRYYAGKGDLLAATIRRAQDRVSAAITTAITTTDNPAAALARLIGGYVELCCSEPDLAFVYHAEIGNLPAADRTTLTAIERLNTEAFTGLLTAVRPAVAPNSARVLVHAALALVIDLGQWMGPRHPECGAARVEHLMTVILFGGKHADRHARRR